MEAIKFCVGKKYERNATIFPGYKWESGEFVHTGDDTVCAMAEIDVHNFNHLCLDLRYLSDKASGPGSAIFYLFDENMQLLESIESHLFVFDSFIENPKCYYFAAEFKFTEEQGFWRDVDYTGLFTVEPHYKSLKKKYAKESGQMFFREKLEGKINLFGYDYDRILVFSVEDTLLFYVYRDDNVYASAIFNKTDCKFDASRKMVELGLTPNDVYTNVLDKYENTYDLIKLAPAMSPVTLTKRCVIQIYVQGDKVISSYAGGTYWETEVDEAVNDANKLQNHYYFARGPKYFEINLTGFNCNINASYRGGAGLSVLNSYCYRTVYGVEYALPCSIVFKKVYSAGQRVLSGELNKAVKLMSDGTSSGVTEVTAVEDIVYAYDMLYDSYEIEIWDGHNGTGTKLYVSSALYGNDSRFTLTAGEGLYQMVAISQPLPIITPQPNIFYIGENIVEYQLWGRLLCGVDQLSDGTATYDLPYDDFATERANYKKCIGLIGFDSENSVVKIIQKNADSNNPTKYGMNDFGEYFTPPYALGSEATYYPIARSEWGNTSLWVALQTSMYRELNTYETWCAKSYQEYTIKDCFHIGNAIKSLLNKIDPDIKHEPTAEYSQFLYGHTGATSAYLRNCQLYITQKTNVLKGNYDEAAKKAEVTLEQIMGMLRDCFRCYWYINEDKKLIIEHVSYFMNGCSYNNPIIDLDFTSDSYVDKFNGKNAIYGQSQISYDKSDLNSRYEFEWADDSTDAMSNLRVDIKNAYIKQDNKESITPNRFSADVDYMLFMPGDFSNDGFALLAAVDGKVPISDGLQIEDKDLYMHFVTTPQNWLVSWNNLIQHYTLDMPGSDLEFNNIDNSSCRTQRTKKCIKHDIEFQNVYFEPKLYRAIKTQFGTGTIDEMSVDFDTRKATMTIAYSI